MHGWNEIGLEIKIQSIICWGGNNFLHSGQWPKTKTKRNRERERERERGGIQTSNGPFNRNPTPRVDFVVGCERRSGHKICVV